MSYPPGNPGYQPTAQTNQFAAPTQQFAKQPESAGAGASKLPLYLSIAVAVLGVAAYFFSYGPFVEVDVSSSLPRLPGLPQEAFEVPNQVVNGGGVLSNGGALGFLALLLAGLIAGVGVLAKQKPRHGVVAVLAVFGFLVTLLQLVTVSGGDSSSAGWALITIVAVAFLQSAAAIANLLLDAGIITAPEPKPKYEQPYGGYAPQYYGQQGGQPGQHQGQPQQRPGYAPQQYGYGAGPGGYPGAAPQSGPPTPPTGFPAYGQPQPAGSSENTGPHAPVQPSQAQPTQQPQQSPPQQAGPPPS